MAKIRATIKSQSDLRSTLQTQRELKIRSADFSLRRLGDLSDINLANAENGSVLVLDLETNQFVATRLLDNQFIEGGQF